ncbi:MAG: BNR-repeat neuraminidase N-terminal domain-containing protein [Planctomycetaceae bacterium]
MESLRPIQETRRYRDSRRLFKTNTTRPWQPWLFFAVVLLGRTLPATADSPLSAVSWQPAHPVLIRNEHSPVTRVVVTVDSNTEVNTKSLTFDLSRSSDLTDLESLSLYATGDQDSFSSAHPSWVSRRNPRGN